MSQLTLRCCGCGTKFRTRSTEAPTHPRSLRDDPPTTLTLSPRSPRCYTAAGLLPRALRGRDDSLNILIEPRRSAEPTPPVSQPSLPLRYLSRAYPCGISAEPTPAVSQPSLHLRYLRDRVPCCASRVSASSPHRRPEPRTRLAVRA